MIAVVCFFLRSRNDRQELLTSLPLPDKVAQTLHQLLRPGKGGPVGGTSDWLTVAESQREELMSSCCQELDPIPVSQSQLSITIAWAATKSICCTRQLLTLSTPPQQCHLIELYKHPSLSPSSYKYFICALFFFRSEPIYLKPELDTLGQTTVRTVKTARKTNLWQREKLVHYELTNARHQGSIVMTTWAAILHVISLII